MRERENAEGARPHLRAARHAGDLKVVARRRRPAADGVVADACALAVKVQVQAHALDAFVCECV